MGGFVEELLKLMESWNGGPMGLDRRAASGEFTTTK